MPQGGCHLLPFGAVFDLPNGSQWGIVVDVVDPAKPLLVMGFPRFSGRI